MWHFHTMCRKAFESEPLQMHFLCRFCMQTLHCKNFWKEFLHFDLPMHANESNAELSTWNVLVHAFARTLFQQTLRKWSFIWNWLQHTQSQIRNHQMEPSHIVACFDGIALLGWSALLCMLVTEAVSLPNCQVMLKPQSPLLFLFVSCHSLLQLHFGQLRWLIAWQWNKSKGNIWNHLKSKRWHGLVISNAAVNNVI